MNGSTENEDSKHQMRWVFFALLCFFAIAFVLIPRPLFAAVDDIVPSKNVKTLHYIWDRSTPEYKTAWEGMKDLYRKSPYDFDFGYASQPPIFYASFDLNNDGQKELIAYPIWQGDDMLLSACKPLSTQCPHFILSVQDEHPKLIGKIMANAVDVSDKDTNGYRTLKAYSFEDDAAIDPKKFSYYFEYSYSPEKQSYVQTSQKPKHDKGIK